MQISISMGAKTKDLPQGAVIGNRCHALRATSHHHRHLRQLLLKYESGPLATCVAELRAQTFASSKRPQTLRSNQRSEPGSKAYQYTCRGNRPTRYRRRPKGVVPNGARPPKLFGRPANLTACSYGPSKVSKNFNINRAQKIRNY